MSFFGDMRKSIQAEIGEDTKPNQGEQIGPDAKQIDHGETGTGEPLTHEDNRQSSNTPTNYDLDNINIDDLLNNAPVNEKGNKIVPDDVFDKYYKLLPDGTINESRSWRATKGGKLIILGGDPERDRDIHRQGGITVQATLKHRRTLAEDLKIALSQKASIDAITEYNLPADATNQEAVTAAAVRQAIEGNVKAQQYIRDTIGEQPTTKQDINVGMTDEDRKLLDNIERRLNE